MHQETNPNVFRAVQDMQNHLALLHSSNVTEQQIYTIYRDAQACSDLMDYSGRWYDTKEWVILYQLVTKILTNSAVLKQQEIYINELLGRIKRDENTKPAH